jgi:hypothetical protein
MVMTLGLPACGLAQWIFPGGGGGFTSPGVGVGSSSKIGGGGPAVNGRPVGIGNLRANFRTDPPLAAFPRGLNFSYRGRSSSGESDFSRALIDTSNHVYFGYELILQQQQPGTYLATFGTLGLSPMEAAANTGSNWTEWSMRDVALPDPRVVHDGDVISIELMIDAATSNKLIDDIKVQPFSQPLGRGGPVSPPPNLNTPDFGDRPIPTVAGNVRDFSGVNAELELAQPPYPPRVTLNGILQETISRTSTAVHGSLVWFYLPDHGRYVLSLAPHPDLDFKPAGEVRGGVITFTVDGDSIKLESPNPMASGDAPYHLYVLHDPDWEPTAQKQKGQFAAGSVNPGELAALKRK